MPAPLPGLFRALKTILKTGLADQLVSSVNSKRKHEVLKISLFDKITSLRNIIMTEGSVNSHGILAPPECVKGMKVLDTSKFKKYVMIPTLEVPVEHLQGVTKDIVLRTTLLHIPGIAQIGDLAANNPRRKKFKLLMLNPEQFNDVEDMDDEVRDALLCARVNLETWKKYKIQFTYDNWNYADILAAILPSDSQSVAGYSMIGHIIHINLKEHLMEYKSIIGEVLLDKVFRARTVVNKTSAIDNTFRNFQLEVIAGEPNFITTAREHGIEYKMDFSKVYWNPRLSSEHQRIVKRIEFNDTVFDMFAGIGPFAIPACRKKAVVFANDLNPESYKWLNENIKINKVNKYPITTYNMDGREFAQTVIKPELFKLFTGEVHNGTKVHIAMNLPALAIEFLDVFPGLLNQDEENKTCIKHNISVTVYCYCFSKEDDFHSDIKTRMQQSMGVDIPECEIRLIRNVAPNKNYFCVTLSLSQQVLFSLHKENAEDDVSEAEPVEKKQRCQ